MNDFFTYSLFSNQSVQQKVAYFDKISMLELPSNKSIVKKFLQEIFNNEENLYIRKQALDWICNFTYTNSIRPRFTIDFLLDIQPDEDIFILIPKLKNLFVLYDGNEDMFAELVKFTNHIESEVSSEAYFRLGLVYFFSLEESLEFISFLDLLVKAKQHFQSSCSIIENRVDAFFFLKICDYLELTIGNEKTSDLVLENISEILYSRQLFSFSDKLPALDLKIYQSILHIQNICTHMQNEEKWQNFKDEMLLLFGYVTDLTALNDFSDTLNKISFVGFQKALQIAIINSYYLRNLNNSAVRLEALIAQSEDYEFKEFLNGILVTLKSSSEKKNFSLNDSLVQLARSFPKIPLDKIKRDLEESDLSTKSLVKIILEYSHNFYTLQNRYRTGYTKSEEVLDDLAEKIRNLLPGLSSKKFYSFCNTLSDLIRYAYQTAIQPKSLFPELYDSSLKDERSFQDSIYRNITKGENAHCYAYEPRDIGGGRIDIIYKEDGWVFPIEVKTSETIPTIESIKKDYLSQIQTYTFPYQQLGILLTFDLSSKKRKGVAPLNDFRDWFTILNMAPYYDLPLKFPDYVISILVPANKVNPSSSTTYR